MAQLNSNDSQNPREVCPVCLDVERVRIRDAYDDRYGNPGLFSLWRCASCGHWMTAPRLREDQLGDLYSNYYPRKHVDVPSLRLEAAKVLEPHARLKRWWSGTDNQGQYTVRPGEKILDVGSGSGLSLLEATALGARAFGVEADPNTRRIADELGLNVHIGSLHDNPFPDQNFDLIVLNQVIEHIPDPGAALERIRGRLAPGGRVVMVLPNRNSFWCRLSGERWINWHIPYHLHHFSAMGFRAFSRRHGFEVSRSRTITPNVWTILQLRVMREVPQRGVPSSVWAVKPAEPAPASTSQIAPVAKSRPWRRFARLAVFSASAAFNRLIDALGFGDSLIVELRVGDRT